MVKVSIPALLSRTPAEMPPMPAPTIATVGVPPGPNRSGAVRVPITHSPLGGGLEVGERLGHAVAGARHDAVEVLLDVHLRRHAVHELAVARQHLPVLGDLGALTGGREGVRPTHQLAGVFHAAVREGELLARL